jgi:large subunit ribosomal protein L3
VSQWSRKNNFSGKTQRSMRKIGLYCMKVGMTNAWENGKLIGVTVLQVLNFKILREFHENLCKVWVEMPGGRLSKSDIGQIPVVKNPRGCLREIDLRSAKQDLEFFKVGSFYDIRGRTVGKGYQGGMKRHGFKGFCASHGVTKSHRGIGSIGQQDVGRVFKNRKMAGRMGYRFVTVQNMEILAIKKETRQIVVRGSVPGKACTRGANQQLLFLSPAIRMTKRRLTNDS